MSPAVSARTSFRVASLDASHGQAYGFLSDSEYAPCLAVTAAEPRLVSFLSFFHSVLEVCFCWEAVDYGLLRTNDLLPRGLSRLPKAL